MQCSKRHRYSITSSARASRDGGTSIPSAEEAVTNRAGEGPNAGGPAAQDRTRGAKEWPPKFCVAWIKHSM